MTLTEFLLARIAEDEIHEPIQAAHVLRWHHARVLAECEAKRQIIARFKYASTQADTWSEPNAVAWGDSLSEADSWEKIAGALELCCQSLASIYADHPDYLQEWAL